MIYNNFRQIFGFFWGKNYFQWFFLQNCSFWHFHTSLSFPHTLSLSHALTHAQTLTRTRTHTRQLHNLVSNGPYPQDTCIMNYSYARSGQSWNFTVGTKTKLARFFRRKLVLSFYGRSSFVPILWQVAFKQRKKKFALRE